MPSCGERTPCNWGLFFNCCTDFDIQAIGAHEIGHFYGLGHTASGLDATMAPSAAKGESQKQTLTPGDVTGFGLVAP